MTRCIRLLAGVILGVAPAASRAGAQSVPFFPGATPTVFRAAFVNTCLGPVPGPRPCSLGADQQLTYNGGAAINRSYGSVANGAQLTANVAATSTYGLLRARASNSFNLATPNLVEANAVGIFEDVITVRFAPFTGRRGLLTVNYRLSGTVSSSAPADRAFVDVDVFVDQDRYNALHPASTSGVFSTKTFSFIYGQPFGLHFDLAANTGTITPVPLGYLLTPGNGVGTASADFFNTLSVSGLLVADANGVPVTGATFTSASGTRYGLGGVVPEPSSLLMLLPGLGVLRVMRLRRSHPGGAPKIDGTAPAQ